MSVRRWLCLATALLCVTALFGCAAPLTESGSSSMTDVPAPQQSGPSVFSLPYSGDDTLNPFAAATEVNLQLAGLLFDSLTVVDGTFTPRLSLASAIDAVDATHIKVTLRREALFSDGTSVQLSDVVASYRAARESRNYRALLANVTAAKADSRTGTVTFTLAKADPHAAACLSFPVYKAASATTERRKAPIGGGAYVLTQTEEELFLQRNPNRKEACVYQRIGLRHLPSSDSMYYGLASQDITYYYNDLSAGDIPRVSASSAVVDMNALLFLGVNSTKEGLSAPAVRRALSSLIDRATLVSSVYAGWAKPALTPFHPAWSGAQGLTGLSASRDLAGALELLNADGYGTGTGQKELALELIYCQDGPYRSAVAGFVRSELASAGVAVTAVPLSYADYVSRLNAGTYDLYLGEVRLTPNMDLFPLLAGGSAGYGVAPDGAAGTAYTGYREGSVTAEAFTSAFVQDMPYIPLCWRCGFAAYDRRLSTVTPHGYDPYYGFINWR
ncbi:MAG: ABC transporter substrate-binding protein [Ruminococcaceae bacterium]|nr:ABC transporter substrate-binding protein [Oscillospiraceae bacterium]